MRRSAGVIHCVAARRHPKSIAAAGAGNGVGCRDCEDAVNIGTRRCPESFKNEGLRVGGSGCGTAWCIEPRGARGLRARTEHEDQREWHRGRRAVPIVPSRSLRVGETEDVGCLEQLRGLPLTASSCIHLEQGAERGRAVWTIRWCRARAWIGEAGKLDKSLVRDGCRRPREVGARPGDGQKTSIRPLT